MAKTYLFTVSPATPPAMTIDPGAEIEVTVDGAFDDIEDIAAVPTPFTPASEGHPLAPVTGPHRRQRRAAGGFGGESTCSRSSPSARGANAVLRAISACSRRNLPSPPSSPARSATGRPGSETGWRSRSPPISAPSAPCHRRATGPSHAGPYGGDFDQRDVGIAPASTCR